MPSIVDGGAIITPSTVGFVDAATTAWVNAVITNGGTVSGTQQSNVDTLIKSLKSNGIFSKLDRLWLHAAENTAQALTDIIADALATVNGSPTFTTNRGYTGVDNTTVTDYIDSGFNASTAGGNYTQNAAHMSTWSVTNNASNAGGFIMGVDGFSGGTFHPSSEIVVTFSDGNVYGRISDDPSSASQGAPSSRIGHWLLNRSGASATQLYQNASLFSSPNGTSAALVNFTHFILAANRAGGGAGFGTPNQIAMTSLGGNLSSTDVTNFYNALRTYMTAVGVP